MADIDLTVYDVARTVAAAPNWTDNKTAATSGNSYLIANNGRVIVMAEADASATLTFATPGTQGGLAISDLALSLADTDIRIFGTFPPSLFNDQSTGEMTATVSANTDLMAIRV